MSTTTSPQPSVDDVEMLLRDALHARARQVTEGSLGPRQLLWTDTGADRRTGPGLVRRSVAPLAAAAVVVGVAGVGSGLIPLPAGDTRPQASQSSSQASSQSSPQTPSSALGAIQVVAQITDAGDGSQRLTIGFGRQKVKVAGTAAVSVRPVAVVTGGTPTLRETTRAAAQQLVDALTERYGQQLRRLGATTAAVEQKITVRAATQRAGDVTIVFNVVEDYRGTVPNEDSAAVVLSKRTGAAVTASDLFSPVKAADAIMHKALQKKYDGQLDPQVLAGITMSSRVGERTPLTWYPTKAGLHWVVARGALGPDALGSVSVVVPWTSLNRVSR